MLKRILLYDIVNSRHLMERWLSGRRHRSRKAAGAQAPRGFDSLPLRQFEVIPNYAILIGVTIIN